MWTVLTVGEDLVEFPVQDGDTDYVVTCTSMGATVCIVQIKTICSKLSTGQCNDFDSLLLVQDSVGTLPGVKCVGLYHHAF